MRCEPPPTTTGWRVCGVTVWMPEPRGVDGQGCRCARGRESWWWSEGETRKRRAGQGAERGLVCREGGAKQLNPPPPAYSLPHCLARPAPTLDKAQLLSPDGTVPVDPTTRRVLARPSAPTSRRWPRPPLVGVICPSTRLSPPRECSRMAGTVAGLCGCRHGSEGPAALHFSSGVKFLQRSPSHVRPALPLCLPACGPSTHLGTPWEDPLKVLVLGKAGSCPAEARAGSRRL